MGLWVWTLRVTVGLWVWALRVSVGLDSEDNWTGSHVVLYFLIQFYL